VVETHYANENGNGTAENGFETFRVPVVDP
jgi:hypothetical protein